MKAAVLVVDDEKSVLKGLKMSLEGRYKVFEASDGQEALRVFKKESPDIVLMEDGNQYNHQVKKIIDGLLEKADNNIQKAAELLDMPVHKFRYLLKKINDR